MRLFCLAASLSPVLAGGSSALDDDPSLFTSRFTSRPVRDDLLSFVEACERSISCAGVSLDPNGTIAGGSKLYRHSFVGPFRTPTTYETRSKDFTYHRGAIRISASRDEVIEIRDDVTVAQAKERCASALLPDCVAFSYPTRSLKNLDRPPSVTFVREVRSYVPSTADDFRTYVNNDRSREGGIRHPEEFVYDGRVAANPYSTCCDGAKTDVPPMEEVRKVDTLKRISCDLSREEFFLQYELPRTPVMLVGCDKQWPAATGGVWEPRHLAERFSNSSRWRARISDVYDEDYNHNAKWGDVVENMLSGEPYYLFDQLINPEAKAIEEEYEDPKPMQGGDLYTKLSYFAGPLRWFNVGPAGTGTMSHLDPYGTDAWNSLIKGHKWWILYPEGFTDESKLECDERCSVETPLTHHWYASIGVNAARSEYTVTPPSGGSGYGRHVLQKAGETIYVPDGLIHSVYNYDEVIAITKNYASAANLDTVWRETVTFGGSGDKWRSLYYNTLNREQRRRVRSGKYWPPYKWEEDDNNNGGVCEADEGEDEMTEYPLRGPSDPTFAPKVGELIEAAFSSEETEDDDDGEYEEFWAMARVLSVQDDDANGSGGLASIEFLLDEQPNDGASYQFEFLRPLPRAGDIIEARYGGGSNGSGGGGSGDGAASSNEWYRATVTAAHHGNATWDVRYDGIDGDGEAELGLTRASIREFHPYRKGDMVQMKWEEEDGGEELWIDSVITTDDAAESESATATATAMDAGNTKADVRHFDGEEIKGVEYALLRRVRWEFEEGDDVIVTTMDEGDDGEEEAWYPGRVVKVWENGRYDVAFDDGDSAECQSWRALSFQWATEE